MRHAATRGDSRPPLWRYLFAAAVVAVALLVQGAALLAVPGSYRDEVLADNPAGYWRLGETGSTAADETANTNPGSYLGGVTRGVQGALAGDLNTAARFDGGDDRVSMGDPGNGLFDFGSSDFSVEAWIKQSANGNRTLIGKRSSSSRYWHVLVTSDAGHVGQLRANLRDGSVLRQGYSLARVDDAVWHHVVVQFDRDSGISFFVDGAASGFTAGAMTGDVGSSSNMIVGKVSGYGYFQGDIDEVAVYRSLPSLARIQAHYLAGTNDTLAPAVTLVNPPNGSSTGDTTPTYSGAAGNAPGDSATVTVKVYAGPDTSGTLVDTLSATRSASSYSVDATAPLVLGTYTAQAQQSDSASNVGFSTANTFQVVEAPPPPPPPPPGADPLLIGAGDIASCDEWAGDKQTADLLDLFPTASVFTVGDNVYINGTANEFSNCYAPGWGRAKARTRQSRLRDEQRDGLLQLLRSQRGRPDQGLLQLRPRRVAHHRNEQPVQRHRPGRLRRRHTAGSVAEG
jgi:hypothetical protein